MQKFNRISKINKLKQSQHKMENYLKDIAFKGVLSLLLSFGNELGLFDALAATGSHEEPATAAQLAEKSGIDLEFASVWLNGMVIGEIIECNEECDKFWIASENLKALSGEEPAAGLIYNRLLPLFSSHYKQAIELAQNFGVTKAEEKQHGHSHAHEHVKSHLQDHQFQQSHGHGQEHDHQHHDHGNDEKQGHNHADVFPLMELISKTTYRKHLIPDFLPLIGLDKKLENGGMEVLDVGCGPGVQICEFARSFPECNFTGIDISENSIKRAKEVAKEMNLKNVKFEVMGVEELPEAWSNKFNWVYSWNSLHHCKDPKIAINEIHRVLATDGRYTMIEMNKPKNLKDYGTTPMSKYWAVAYLFRISPNHPEIYKWTNAAAIEMLKETGFKNLSTVKPSFYEFNVIFDGTK